MHAGTAEPFRVTPPEAVVYQILIKTKQQALNRTIFYVRRATNLLQVTLTATQNYLPSILRRVFTVFQERFSHSVLSLLLHVSRLTYLLCCGKFIDLENIFFCIYREPSTYHFQFSSSNDPPGETFLSMLSRPDVVCYSIESLFILPKRD